MALTKFRPSFSLIIGGVNVSHDLLDLTLDAMVTNAAPQFNLLIDNRRGIYNSLKELDTVVLTVDSVPLINGRIDTINYSLEKPPTGQGRTLPIHGRGAFGALCDVVANKCIRDLPADAAVDEVLGLYNSLKLSKDPVIYMNSNRAPSGARLTYQWTAKSIQEMLFDISTFLGAPVAFGGVATYYDFYVTPSLGLVFEPSGYRDSGINLGSPVDYEKKDRLVDSLPIKNDVWITGDEVSGCIPLEMMPGYGIQSATERRDPWTEGNAVDFKYGPNVASIGDSPTQKQIGNQSIWIYMRIPKAPGEPDSYAYFYMRFPFPDDGSKWPSQDPAGGLNALNMTRLHETMGEISAIGFFLYPSHGTTFLIEVVDGTTPTTIASETMSLQGETWQYFQWPFGPASGIGAKKDYTIVDPDPVEYPDTVFDWLNIAEIRFKFIEFGFEEEPVLLDCYFDGFRFIKPLVAHWVSGAATTFRPLFQSANELTTYGLARAYAYAICQERCEPQAYYELKNLARIDIPPGSKFVLDSKSLVARSIKYRMNKLTGWNVEMEGWEAT